MSSEAAFLRTVCARPDDDLPRLVYADWLEEHSGDMPDPDAARARAEFIRVQVELARTPGNSGCYEPGTDRPGHDPGTVRCRKCDLAVRAEKLFVRLPMESLGGETSHGSWRLTFTELKAWERGFAASVERIDAECWLVHADEILARFPIRRVAMIDWPGADIFDHGLRSFQVRGWLNHQFSDWVDQSCTDRQFIRRMLAKEWPGIAFELPAIHDDR